ncbi:hypothetical protein [Myroides odoratus]|uniref:Uncharacterized protein n=1 Tax=Myroides odoratus TaxID=256 RepID=A0A9Q6Z5D7_MYROD|nr:hypothetical protein [Myroides odoratus]EHQ44002.1 hypothetical protein Myrod_3189 [Myroides odoratus DSM 2801]EKB05097.1 hypothetical protein HMPREF9716_02904 [Myroides odoratus CIP 103059]QQU01301.1 hypothetical protein I6I88_06005 [Myroides odoratus]WQD56436.1 hypothetical protein U0010_13010 [Myroides odoratus]STZ31284.1 Uncharacterised protein [Myroides odoratus]
MGTNDQPHTLSANDQHNLALLEALYDLNPSFAAYAQSINELFYYYVQNCTEKADDFLLNPLDVQSILEVVHTLQQLKEPKLE